MFDIHFVSIVVGSFILATLTLMIGTSFYEGRPKAAQKAIYTLPLPFILIVLPFIQHASITQLLYIINLPIIGFSLYLFLPAFLFRKNKETLAVGNIDERNIMFSRNELEPGKERYHNYYNEFPEHKENDDEFRKLPGLLGTGSRFSNQLAYSATHSIFKAVDVLHPLVDGETAEEKPNISKEKYAQFIQSWLKHSGALSSGFTETKDYHWYSVGGRGDRYGKKINTQHKIAIAFTVEMDQKMVEAAPQSSIIMESANRYLQAGVIATQLAEFIRQNGYEARAHIDGNYQVVAPLVARDAGLGEIGRMGLLMTPKYGPRIRLGVVSTNMPLPISRRNFDDSMEDFCEKCKKCATNCPANAISENPKENINNIERWQINSEACFKYWCTAGTDCGRCMATCPYSHPNNMLHKIVRWSIRSFPNIRYWAVKLDDYFYGKKTSIGKLPDWLSY